MRADSLSPHQAQTLGSQVFKDLLARLASTTSAGGQVWHEDSQQAIVQMSRWEGWRMTWATMRSHAMSLRGMVAARPEEILPWQVVLDGRADPGQSAATVVVRFCTPEALAALLLARQGDMEKPRDRRLLAWLRQQPPASPGLTLEMAGAKWTADFQLCKALAVLAQQRRGRWGLTWSGEQGWAQGWRTASAAWGLEKPRIAPEVWAPWLALLPPASALGVIIDAIHQGQVWPTSILDAVEQGVRTLWQGSSTSGSIGAQAQQEFWTAWERARALQRERVLQAHVPPASTVMKVRL